MLMRVYIHAYIHTYTCRHVYKTYVYIYVHKCEYLYVHMGLSSLQLRLYTDACALFGSQHLEGSSEMALAPMEVAPQLQEPPAKGSYSANATRSLNGEQYIYIYKCIYTYTQMYICIYAYINTYIHM